MAERGRQDFFAGGDMFLYYGRDGRLIPTPEEAERQRADAERQRADAAEAEIARLRALLEPK